jgi:hypothetical protein
MSQFAAPMTSWWETLSNPTLTRGLQERLTEGISSTIFCRVWLSSSEPPRRIVT